MALQASVKRGTAEMGDRLFQTTKAIVDREPHASAVDDDQRLRRQIEHGRYGPLWPLARVLRRAPASPFGDCFGIDPKPRGKSPEGFLALLDLATHLHIRAGVRMKSSSHFSRQTAARCTMLQRDMICKTNISLVTLSLGTNEKYTISFNK